MNNEKIQNHARNLQIELWQERDLLWPNRQVTPFDVLSPEAAARILRLDYVELNDLGSDRFAFRGQRFRVAGLIDRQARKIAVSNAFARETVRFTGAHEVGHWLLHPGQVMHRDRPVDGATVSTEKRPLFEREADYFAACFLIPARLLGDCFRERFGTKLPFVIDDATAFHLNPGDPDLLLRAEEESLARELAIAKCGTYNGSHFYSLAEQFGVSRSAMAIRLKELQLIRWP